MLFSSDISPEELENTRGNWCHSNKFDRIHLPSVTPRVFCIYNIISRPRRESRDDFTLTRESRRDSKNRFYTLQCCLGYIRARNQYQTFSRNFVVRIKFYNAALNNLDIFIIDVMRVRHIDFDIARQLTGKGSRLLA